MNWMYRMILGGLVLRAPEGEGAGGGGAAASTGQGQNGDKSTYSGDPARAGDAAKELAELKAQNATLLQRLEALEKRGAAKTDPPDDDLREKARREREAADKKSGDSKLLESALRFQLGADAWLKTNASLLPKDVADIFKAADKENFADAIEKDRAIKSGIVQSFFSVQANVDLLTPGLKSQLDDYLKLTKTGKQEKAQVIYDTVFEPAFEMLKRTKKAEALSRGYGSASEADDAYKQKMINLSRKHYLGENHAS